MQKKLLVRVGLLAVTTSLGFGVLTACGGKQAETFSVPQNVTVSGDTVSWSAVEGASEGYTVKIYSQTNDAGNTVTVSEVSLDLLEEVAYLVEGENLIAVKVNAVGKKKESPYSSPVTYTYAPASESQNALEFIALVNAIEGTVTKDSLEKIEAAEAKYAALTSDDKAWDSVKSAKTTLDQKRAAYDALIAAEHKAAAEAFIVQVEAIDPAASDALAKLDAADAAYRALPDKTLDGVAAAKTSLDAKRAAYEAHLAEQEAVAAAQAFINQVNAIGAVSEEGAEAKITAAEQAYAQLSAAAKAVAGVAEAKTLLEEKRAAYEAYLAEQEEAAAAQAAANAFIKQVGEISLAEEDLNDLAVATAEAAYTALSPAAKEVKGVAQANALLAAKKAARAFIKNVNAINITAEGAEAKLTATEAEYTSLSAGHAVILTDVNVVSAKQTLEGKRENYNAYLEVKEEAENFVKKVSAIDITKRNVTVAELEAAIEDAYAAYEELKQEVKEIVADAKSALDNADAQVKAAKKFIASVESLGPIDANSGAKIEASKALYQTLSSEGRQMTVVTEAKTTLDAAEKACQNAVKLQAAVKAFKETVDAIDTAQDKAQAIAAAKTHYDTHVKGEANTGVYNLSGEIITKLTEAELAYYKSLVNAIGTLDAESTEEEAEAYLAALTAAEAYDVHADWASQASTDAAKVASARESYDTYVATVGSVGTFLSAVEALTSADKEYAGLIAAAKTAYEAIAKDEFALAFAGVSEAKDSLDEYDAAHTEAEALAGRFTAATEGASIGKESYNALTALTKEYAALTEGLVKTVFDADYFAAYEAAEAFVTLIRETPDYNAIERYLTETGAADGSYQVVIIRAYKNVLGQRLTLKEGEIPTVKVTYTLGDAEAVTEENIAFVYNENTQNPAYTATLVTVNGADMAKALALDYEIVYPGMQQPTVKTGSAHLAAHTGNTVWLNEQEGMRAVFTGPNDTLAFTNASGIGNVYVNVYVTDDIEADTGDTMVTFKNLPIASLVPVHAGMTEIEFRRAIAKAAPELCDKSDRTVRYVFYARDTQTVGEGSEAYTEVTRTSIRGCSVSGETLLHLVPEDRYYTIRDDGKDPGIWPGADHAFSLIGGTVDSALLERFNAVLADEMKENAPETQLTANNANEYVGIYFTVKSGNEVVFEKELELKNQAYSYKKMRLDWQSQFYRANPEAEDGKIFENLTYYANYYITDRTQNDLAEALRKYFPRGMQWQLTTGDETVMTEVSSVTFAKSELSIPTTAVRRSGDFLEFLRDPNGNGDILVNGEADYAKLTFYRTAEADQADRTEFNAYIRLVEEDNDDGQKMQNVYLYLNQTPALNEQGLKFNNDYKDSYLALDVFKTWFTNNQNLKIDGFALRWDDGWSMTSEYVRSENSAYLYGAVSEPIELSVAVEKTEIPSAAQIGFDNAGNVTFVRAFEGWKNGEIFTTGAAQEVEIRFFQGESETTDYKISLRYDPVTGVCKLYDGETAISEALAGGVKDLWCDGATFNKAIQTYLGDDSFDYVGWNFYTVIVAREGNLIWNGERGEASQTVSYTSAA